MRKQPGQPGRRSDRKDAVSDKRRRIETALAQLSEEFGTIVLVGMPLDTSAPPMIVFNGPTELVWAMVHMAEEKLNDARIEERNSSS